MIEDWRLKTIDYEIDIFLFSGAKTYSASVLRVPGYDDQNVSLLCTAQLCATHNKIFRIFKLDTHD